MPPPTRYRSDPARYRPVVVPVGTLPRTTARLRKNREPAINGRPIMRTRNTISSYTGAFTREKRRYHSGTVSKNEGSGACVVTATMTLRNVTARNVCMIATVALRERSFAGMCSELVRSASHSLRRSRRARTTRHATVTATTAAVQM